MTTTPHPTSPPRGTTGTGPAIEAVGLRRVYAAGFEAVRGVDLAVETGTVTALLGTNGAGKTSTLEVLEGLAAPTDGEVRVLGLDPVADRARVRRRTGVLLQTSGFSGDLTVAETVAMTAATVTRPRPVEEALALLDLTDRAGVRVVALSGGERRRLDLACTLLGRPSVVFLDEPTTGLDPESRHGVWQLVRDLRDGGATVLLTTHYLEEAEALADRLEIMHAGRVVRSGTAAEIVADRPAGIGFTALHPDDARAVPLADLPALVGPPATEAGGHGRPPRTVLRSHDLQVTLTDLLARAAAHDVRLHDLDARAASLEATFLEIARGDDDRERPVHGRRHDRPSHPDHQTDHRPDHQADQIEGAPR